DFLTNGMRTVDCMFQYERIQDFVDFLETRLDCAIELPRINVPPTVDVHLDSMAERQLRQAMSRDLDLYDTL
ncbi:MAG: hypothetical protein L0G27_06195, partial [Paracoccus sp. (in: a-proteobacteria)]|nr:hypothetical protein [Paracoccus sp. (in: a-proteobacteria)]